MAGGGLVPSIFDDWRERILTGTIMAGTGYLGAMAVTGYLGTHTVEIVNPRIALAAACGTYGAIAGATLAGWNRLYTWQERILMIFLVLSFTVGRVFKEAAYERSFGNRSLDFKGMLIILTTCTAIILCGLSVVHAVRLTGEKTLRLVR